MDLFYKPPMQRPDECKVLEENYINCLVQKSQKDYVFNNRCVLDSVLWFQVECPRAFSQFDDPVEFKKKFRDYFASRKSVMENMESTDTAKRIEKEFGHNQGYPEDIRRHGKA